MQSSPPQQLEQLSSHNSFHASTDYPSDDPTAGVDIIFKDNCVVKNNIAFEPVSKVYRSVRLAVAVHG